ncbi:protein kinase family protein [Leptospira koniambonensis]|uniref:Protein kinase family protein n=1 Tax=Leptospira koniambonensis TaxID=2484950 RepID=A0A4R9J7J1_9LEPT|nr:protein kinase family protein [Leptospira koniambonensis]TGL34560.1 protein kinase family protein [Leptospira koniambonensis]
MSTAEITALLCSQCGGALPKQVRWRYVACPYCGVLVTYSKNAVLAEHFHEAWKLYEKSINTIPNTLTIGKNKYKILLPLGGGERADIFFAEKLGLAMERVIIKIERDKTSKSLASSEVSVLESLQKQNTPISAYFSQRLPQIVSFGKIINPEYEGKEAVITRANPGYWGSLSDVLRFQKKGIQPRHGVWIWRRILDLLGYIHEQGWTHNAINPSHLLVQPRDHGILVIGWRRGKKSQDKIKDLQQAAWSIRVLLEGEEDPQKSFRSVPNPLASFIERACEDKGWCDKLGAIGIDEELKIVAEKTFGPPQFIPFSPYSN